MAEQGTPEQMAVCIGLAPIQTYTEALAKAKADAWDEGHKQGFNTAFYAYDDDSEQPMRSRSEAKNPYREDHDEHDADNCEDGGPMYCDRCRWDLDHPSEEEPTDDPEKCEW